MYGATTSAYFTVAIASPTIAATTKPIGEIKSVKPETIAGKIINSGPMPAITARMVSSCVCIPLSTLASLLANVVKKPVSFFTVGINAVPMEMPAASTALFKASKPPFAVSSNTFRAVLAAPAPANCFSVSAAISSPAPCKAGIILPARSPKNSKLSATERFPLVK